MKLKSSLSYLWKLPLCGLAYFIGMAISGMVLPAVGFPTPEMPAGTDANTIMLWYLPGSMILSLVLSFVSRGLRVNWFLRWIILAELTWVFGAGGRLLHFEKIERMVIEGRVPLQDIVGAPQPDELTREKLGELIEQERKAGRDVRAKEVQYHTKLAVPFACVIFSIFGPVFSLAFARSGGFAGVLLSVLVVFAHINLLLLFSKILGEPGVIPPIVAAWAPNAIFLVAALIAMRRVE